MKFSIGLFVIGGLLVMGCGNQPDNREGAASNADRKIFIPQFNEDSAYHFIARQVEFGPRVPNTAAHKACSHYLAEVLEMYSDTVIIQSFKSRAYDGTVLNGNNLIGIFQPELSKRVLLCAHWDSRPFADHDPDPSKRDLPIDGANDGASGVGILLEIARLLKNQPPAIGVDIILFDLEDYGPPENQKSYQGNDWWGLGSQYWSRNPHQSDYSARFGILLDMVGSKDAQFLMEGFSMLYAPNLVKKVWKRAGQLGYGSYFIFEQGGYINDDHRYINEIIKIQTIDIIHIDNSSSNHSFFEHWHTQQDNLDVISKETLKAVGQTVLTLILEER